ncbi:MAG: HlyD family efflux transporter periplasmic adaptor subunit [Oscillospiraceae bacterium]
MENKRREWVKTAAIIFLTIMLLLTFFSNTIMNYSLPEVSAKYVQSGSLSEQIRGTVTVESAQQYEVKFSGSSRVINSVEVKQGDTVEKGQVLLKFEEGESPDLEAAEIELEQKQNEYRKSLMDIGTDYSSAELDIKELEEDIERMKTDLGGSNDYRKKADELKKLNEEVDTLTKQGKEIESQLTHIDEQLTALSSDDYESLDTEYSSKLSPLYASVVKYKAKKEEYDKQVEQITKEFDKEITNEDIYNKQNEISKLESQLSALQERYLTAFFDVNADIISINQSISETQADLNQAQAELSALYSEQVTSNLTRQKLDVATSNQKTFTNSFTKAENELNLQKIEVSKKLNASKKTLKAQAEKNTSELDEAKSKQEQSDADLKLIEQIEDSERSLERKKLELKQTQEKDLVEAGKNSVDIEAMQNEIKRLEEKVNEIKSDAAGGEITAQVAGIISSIKVVAGETVESGSEIASIEMVEKGYTASFSVTIDQAKKVKIGDLADIQYFWGGDAQAKLAQIKSDPSSSQNKLLVFDITGDVTPGQSLQLVLGGKGQPYECIIPNNAIKEDSNGKFVLTVVAKSSPLGNRYIAKRADITVLASDGVNTAVTGVLQSDYIISTSTKPINAGDQVRLVDNG